MQAMEVGYPNKGPLAQAEDHIRRGFVRKVYGILSAQLLLTVLIAAPFSSSFDRKFIVSHMWLYYLSLFASTGFILGIGCCCRQAARRYPTNYMLLFGFTFFEAITIGFVTSLYTLDSVMLAVAVTGATFIGLTVYAFFTKSDFTGFGPYIVAALMGLMCFGLVLSIWSWFMPVPSEAHKMYALMGVLVFCFYIVYDTQLIVGGRHKSCQFDVDDYVFAALNLYLDVVDLFLFILSLLGERRE